MRRFAVILVLVSGCVQGPIQETTCDANNWRDLVGQPEEAVYGALGNLRIVRNGDKVTEIANPSRLNAEIGSDGRVTRFACY